MQVSAHDRNIHAEKSARSLQGPLRLLREGALRSGPGAIHSLSCRVHGMSSPLDPMTPSPSPLLLATLLAAGGSLAPLSLLPLPARGTVLAQAAAARPLAPSLQGKPVVVDIHASWCPACRAIAPTLSKVKKQEGSGAH